jgi:molybdopterin-binding protein
MPRLRLRPPREAAIILGVSFSTVKQWIYKGKLRTVKTIGGHHRILEEDIARHLRSKVLAESLKRYGLEKHKISERNQLLGRILEIKTDDLMAQVRILSGDHELTSLISAQMAADLGLRVGDDVVVILKSTQIMIIRESV